MQLAKSNYTEGVEGENDDQTVGVGIVRRALEALPAPISQIAENAGS